MGYPSLIKLAPYIVVLGLLIGVFFYGVGVGETKKENEYKQAVIDAGKEDIDVEVRQNKIRANRDNYDLSKRLQSGSF